MLGGGEFRHLTRGHTAHHPKHQVIAPLDFNVF
jgi:hypothetical protein